jgi:hypothetical protein
MADQWSSAIIEDYTITKELFNLFN